MKESEVVILGGSAAGLTAAMTAHKHFPDKKITVIRKEQKVLIPCGIPYIFGTVGGCDKNLIPDGFYEGNGTQLIVGEAVEIDPAAHVVKLAGGEKLKYSKLIYALGSYPTVPPLPGVDKTNVFSIRKDIAYLETMLCQLDRSKSMVIVGCGFIGIEFAEECKKRNQDIKIQIVEMQKNCLQLVFDEEFCLKCEKVLADEGIQVLLDERIESISGNGAVEKVVLKSGKKLPADMVLLGIGARPHSELAEKAGLKLGPTGALAVNRYMQTSDPDIFACGDCAEKVSFFDGSPSALKLASIATMEARIAAANLFGTTRANMGVIGIFSTILGNISFAAAGLTETSARSKGYDIIVGEAEAVNRHPGGMPGAAPMKVKLIFEAGSRVLLGGQVVGARSGGELINAISACIHKRMTADDISIFQMGTHPALTASPVAYQLVNAAENAVAQSKARARTR